MCCKRSVYIYCWLVCLLLGAATRSSAQGCPPNIGFELGNFTNWDILAGTADSATGVHLFPSMVIADRHKMYKDTSLTKQLDPIGRFPVNCPNGSGNSIRLGNNLGGAQAEGLNYTFTIPPDRKTFSLIYYYAVVMQNPPHGATEQPKFTAKVFNVTTGQYITCSSFEYIAQYGLPGFQSSSADQTILFKDWTPVTIKLNALAGNTIRLEFATNDCTRGGHFGYAYVDVDENCLSPILGNIVCQYDTAMKLTAPYGFQSYRWFTGDFSKLLGTGATYSDPVIPPDNTEFAVELTPFPNQGCQDTVFTRIHYSTESIVINAPQNVVAACIDDGVNLEGLMNGTGSSPGLIYSFYYDAALTQHVFGTDSVTKSGRYYVKGLNSDGCFASKPVDILVNPSPVYSTVYDNKPVPRPATVDLTAAVSAIGNTVSYWQDAAATIPLTNPQHLEKDGTYYLKITTAQGCSSITPVTIAFVNPMPAIPNAFTPNGDGVHDTWRIDSIKYYPDAVIDVFTRSGQLVFHTSGGYGKPWDGKQNGQDLPTGTYYYVIRLTRLHPAIGGSLTILR